MLLQYILRTTWMSEPHFMAIHLIAAWITLKNKKVITIHFLGTMNACIKVLSNASDSCWCLTFPFSCSRMMMILEDLHEEVCICLHACVCPWFSLSLCLYLCAITCAKTPTSLLLVCDKLFGPHSAAERAVPVQITRRQASGRVHWPGHTDTLWPHFSQRKPHLCKHRKTTVLNFLFLSVLPFSLSCRAGRF